MKKISIYCTFLILFFATTSFKREIPKKQNPKLAGIAVKYVLGTGILETAKNSVINIVNNFLKNIDLKLVNTSYANRSDVEQINLRITDKDGDGNYEYSTYVEDHNNDGIADNLISEELEDGNEEEVIEELLKKELHYIDNFYDGDVDGDGEN